MKLKRTSSLLLCILMLITTVLNEPLSLIDVQAAEMEDPMATITVTPTVAPEDIEDEADISEDGDDDELVDELIDESESEPEEEVDEEEVGELVDESEDQVDDEQTTDDQDSEEADDSENDGIIFDRGMGRDFIFGDDSGEETDPEELIIPDADTARAAGDVAINANFPSTSFAKYVYAEFDKDKNGILSAKEISAVKVISIEGGSRLNPRGDISNLKGIEHFTNLEQLYCQDNNLSSVNLSKNTKLRVLSISYNKLSGLDLSKNTQLRSLTCNNNNLRNLDVSKQTALTLLTCNNNRLSGLNVSKNTQLTSLNCAYNNITNLNLTANTKLDYVDCSNNKLTGLNISKNAVMAFLDCSNNQLTTLNTNGNKNLMALLCSNNKITSLNFSSNPNLIHIVCSKNALKVLEIPNKLKLEYLEFNGQTGMSTYLSYIKETKDQSIEANWQAVKGASGYDLYRCDKAFSNWEIVTKGIKGTTFKDAKVRLSETYNYMVYAYQNTATGKRYFATSVSEAKKLSPPLIPQKLRTSIIDAMSMKISWNKVNKANGYVVYVSTSKNGTYSAIGATTETSYDSKNLKAGTTYYYKVRAYVHVGPEIVYSGYSATTSRKQTVPKVMDVKVTNSGANSLRLSWSRVVGVSGYEIYQATRKGGKYKKVATVKKEATVSRTIKKLSHKKRYYFKIRAYKTVDGVTTKGSYSAVVNRKVILVKPTLTATTRNKTSINLSWEKVNGAKSYEIYRATSKKGKYKKIATTKSLKYTSKKLKKNKRYYYKIRAVQKIGRKTYRSSFSAMKSARTKK